METIIEKSKYPVFYEGEKELGHFFDFLEQYSSMEIISFSIIMVVLNM